MIDTIDTEKSILGLILNKETLLDGEFLSLEKSYFDNINHKHIFNIINKLRKLNTKVDIVSVSDQLKQDKLLEQIGGRAYINDLALNAPETVFAKFQFNILEKNYQLRQIHNIGYMITEKVKQGINPDELISDSLDKLNTLLIKGEDNDDTVKMQEECEELINRYSSEEEKELFYTSYPDLDNIIQGTERGDMVILGADPGVGKALPKSTKVLTPNGWKLNQDIKVGDKVIGFNGQPTKVVGVFPQGVTQNYKITLKDGREVISCKDHQWAVNSCRFKEQKVLTTQELFIKNKLVKYKNRMSLPKFRGNYGKTKSFRVPPYILGVLIGDGCLTRSGLSYCKPSQEILDNVNKQLPTGFAHFTKDKRTVSICNFYDGINYIKSVGLNVHSYDKFIPEEYFHSSLKQRQELFQGLMDTDGHKCKNGFYEYSTTSVQLSRDVQQLAWSLGYNCRIVERMGGYKKEGETIETRKNYRVYISDLTPQTIVKVEKVKDEETQCIHVDNEDHLFVIEDYIVTHNSAFRGCLEVSAHYQMIPCHVFNLEMSREKETDRLVSNVCEIDIGKFTTNKFTDTELKVIRYKKDEILSKMDLTVYNNSSADIPYIRKKLQAEQKRRGQLGVVIIDHFHRIVEKGDAKERATSLAIKLKQIALDFNCYLIVLCHLRKRAYVDIKTGQTRNPKPTVSDLKDSQAIEGNADTVVLIHREDLDSIRSEFIIPKNRHGGCGECYLSFYGKYMKFSSSNIKHL